MTGFFSWYKNVGNSDTEVKQEYRNDVFSSAIAQRLLDYTS
jgi:hypothetical protein